MDKSWDRSLFFACTFIFALTVGLRLPSCAESLWVDELHTAWVVSDGFDAVAPRAAIGNQTPWYFWGMWNWTRLTGLSEISLRLPSVLAIAFTSCLLIWCQWRISNHVLPAVLAGLLMAIDRNSLYFGTEARAYSLVILSVAAWLLCAVESGLLASPASPHKLPATKRMPWLICVCIVSAFAVMMHLTAALVLTALTAMMCSFGNGSRRTRLCFAISSLVGLVIGCGISLRSATQVWAIRDQWNAFGKSTSIFDIANMWPWLWMLVLPAVLLGLQTIRGDTDSSKHDKRYRSFLVLWGTIMGATILAWGISFFDVASIWHRRYIVGLIPVLCLAGATTWWSVIERLTSRRWRTAAIALIIFGLVFNQESLLIFASGDSRVVRRQEEWRGAIAYLTQRIEPADQVLLAAELIESNWLSQQEPVLTERQRAYLLFPAAGLYRVEQAEPVGPIGSSHSNQTIINWLSRKSSSESDLWIIARMTRAVAVRRLADLQDQIEQQDFQAKVELIPFRKLTLVRISR